MTDHEGLEAYLTRLKSGELKLYALEQSLPPDEAVAVRRAFIEGETGAHLAKLGSYTIGIGQAVQKNCENMIGAVQVPVGVAGPLRVRGEYADGEF